jgi:hypothetical protein
MTKPKLLGSQIFKNREVPDRPDFATMAQATGGRPRAESAAGGGGVAHRRALAASLPIYASGLASHALPGRAWRQASANRGGPKPGRPGASRAPLGLANANRMTPPVDGTASHAPVVPPCEIGGFACSNGRAVPCDCAPGNSVATYSVSQLQLLAVAKAARARAPRRCCRLARLIGRRAIRLPRPRVNGVHAPQRAPLRRYGAVVL